MICACLASVSDTAIIPLADWLHLGAEGRINTPSTQQGNWQWRLNQPLVPALRQKIRELTQLYGRLHSSNSIISPFRIIRTLCRGRRFFVPAGDKIFPPGTFFRKMERLTCATICT